MPKPKPTPSDLRVTVLPAGRSDAVSEESAPHHPGCGQCGCRELGCVRLAAAHCHRPQEGHRGGHTRHKAALQLGWTHAPTVTIPAKHARAYRLADNRSGEFSTWNLDVLAASLRRYRAACWKPCLRFRLWAR